MEQYDAQAEGDQLTGLEQDVVGNFRSLRADRKDLMLNSKLCGFCPDPPRLRHDRGDGDL